MNRKNKESWEKRGLHPAAFRADQSTGRAFPEAEDLVRTCFERDRDRIIHSTAFRRLEQKTQVFVSHVGDHHRTRLTHSLEVVQVARSLANSLDLNESLVEAVALSHDLGHPPCGHAGEKRLDELMQAHGGFNHNLQVLRIVTLLERRSPAYKGLNLTKEVLQCLRKHQQVVDTESGERLRFPLLEMQLVDLADSTAYHYHDVDDGIRAGILDPEKMQRDLPLWNMAVEAVMKNYKDFNGNEILKWRRVANELLGMTIEDIQTESRRRLEEQQPANYREAQLAPNRLIGHSKRFRSLVAELHDYLYQYMYYDDRVNWYVRRATDLMEKVFLSLLNNPESIPKRFFEEADSDQRAVCDYVAGMTDRYVERIGRELAIIPY